MLLPIFTSVLVLLRDHSVDLTASVVAVAVVFALAVEELLFRNGQSQV